MRNCLLGLLLAMIVSPGVGCKSSADKGPGLAVVQAAPAHYGDPPSFDAGIGVEQAYVAIPRRRTIWTENGTTAPAEERAYLRAIFPLLDQAVVVRVAAMQGFANGRFDYIDADAEYELLIKYVRRMAVPPRLAVYHNHILSALNQHQDFFRSWKMQGESFWEKQRVGRYPDARDASAELKAAYGKLMTKYPAESAGNKEAFYDYHCALDFM